MRKGCLAALFAGSALAGVVGAAILGVSLLLGGMVSALGLGSESTAGAAAPAVPPMASAKALPAERLPLMAEEGPGIPNSLVAALMVAGSRGQVFGDTYYCSNRLAATARCATVYDPGPLGVAGTAHTVGVAKGERPPLTGRRGVGGKDSLCARRHAHRVLARQRCRHPELSEHVGDRLGERAVGTESAAGVWARWKTVITQASAATCCPPPGSLPRFCMSPAATPPPGRQRARKAGCSSNRAPRPPLAARTARIRCAG